jgi:hypothetical protein
MPLILGANSLTGGYEIDNSLRFENTSTDGLTRTITTSGNRQIWTWSGWVKRSKLTNATGNPQILFNAGENTPGILEILIIRFNTDDKFLVVGLSNNGSTTDFSLTTNAVYRDVSAWYHVVVAFDSTQATASNRVKIYINGVQETSLSATYPSLNYDSFVNFVTRPYYGIGDRINTSGQLFAGYMSEINFIDGQALDETSFGKFDSATGIWTPIAYTGTYGTNGFYLEFKDSSALGDDTSGNGNDFTVNNLTSIDQTTDTPTNNFATLNPLHSSTSTLSDGNLTVVANTDFVGTFATIGVNKGKWYFEAKINSSVSPQDNYIGVSGDNASTSSSPQSNNPSVLYVGDGSIVKDNSSVQSGLTGFSAGNIIGVALNMDDLEIEFYNNGVKQGSTQSMSAYSGFYLPFYIGANGRTSSWNFGSPPFTISSGNADGAGFGNFEYSVPSGYFALCTKNLAEYG